MKKEFSTKWVASTQRRKQRKYVANAPLHVKGKMLGAHLSKELRQKYKKRSLRVRKGDKVKVMRGKHKGKTGEVDHINTKKLKVYVTNIEIIKKDGNKVLVALRPSNLQIQEINTTDKKRVARLEKNTVKAQ